MHSFKKTNRREETIKTAFKMREKAVKIINNLLIDQSMRLFDLHLFYGEYQKVMNPVDRMNKNLLLNRIQNVGIDDNMGLDLVLNSEKTSKIVLIAMRFWTDRDLYYKKPTNVFLNEFVDSILQYYYYLIVDPAVQYYHLLSIRKLLTYTKPRLRTSKDNKNRIIFCKERGVVITPGDYREIPTKGGIVGFGFYEELSLVDALKGLIT